MIAQDSLKTLAQKYQTTELNIRREYIQHLFLSYFYQQPEANKIFFKGGTALKILYKSPRFSEDLDFSTSLSFKDPIEKALIHSLHQIEKEGIASELKEAKITSGGYLTRITLEIHKQSVEIFLQISLREGEKNGEFLTVINDFVPTYTIMALIQEQLIAEKIQALLTRRKPRDFYDLYFILRANLLPARKMDILTKVLEVVRSTDFNFEHELKLFLPKSHGPILRDFPVTLEREIRRFI